MIRDSVSPDTSTNYRRVTTPVGVTANVTYHRVAPPVSVPGVMGSRYFIITYLLCIFPAFSVLGSVWYFFSTRPERIPFLTAGQDSHGTYQYIKELHLHLPDQTRMLWNASLDSDDNNFHGYAHSMNLLFRRDSPEDDVITTGHKHRKTRAKRKGKFAFHSFREAVRKSSSRDKRILLKMVAEHEAELAMNFYETSLSSNGVDHYLFFTLDRTACRLLKSRDIPCYVYRYNDYFDHSDFIFRFKLEEKMAKFRTQEAEVYIKVKVMYDVLRWGYTVLFVDSNTFVFRDPFQNARAECRAECEMTLTASREGGVSRPVWGIHFVRPTSRTVHFYSGILYSLLETHIVDRLALQDNEVLLRGLELHLRNRSLKYTYLDPTRYQSIRQYFYYQSLGDVRTSHAIAVFETRQSRSTEENTFLLKEANLWKVNVDQYYTSSQRLYLTYDNSVSFTTPRMTVFKELLALRNALIIAHILDRVVILPRFHCPPPPFERTVRGQQNVTSGDQNPPSCILSDLLRMADFDREFGGKYRESRFLNSNQIPKNLRHRKEKSRRYLISRGLPPDADADRILLLPPNASASALDDNDIRNYLSRKRSHQLIVFQYLYSGFKQFSNINDTVMFNRKIQSGFKPKVLVKPVMANRTIHSHVST